MLLARVAALTIIASQIILLWLVYDPRGTTAIVFTFVGHPLVAIGFVLAALARRRRRARERRAAAVREATAAF